MKLVSYCGVVEGRSSEIRGEVGTADVADNLPWTKDAGRCRRHVCVHFVYSYMIRFIRVQFSASPSVSLMHNDT